MKFFLGLFLLCSVLYFTSCKRMFPEHVYITKVVVNKMPTRAWDFGFGSETQPDIYLWMEETKKKRNQTLRTNTSWDADTANLPITLVIPADTKIRYIKSKFRWKLFDEDKLSGDETMIEGQVEIDPSKSEQKITLEEQGYSIDVYYSVK